jgi:hypothetical protein
VQWIQVAWDSVECQNFVSNIINITGSLRQEIYWSTEWALLGTETYNIMEYHYFIFCKYLLYHREDKFPSFLSMV